MSKLLKATRKHYEAQIAEAEANLEIILHNNAGIGDHTDFQAEVRKWLEQLDHAESVLGTLGKHSNQLIYQPE